MKEKAENIVNLLIKRKEQIASMESCTGGGFANSITNIPGSSEVFKFGAVTYSNEYKIKMGVSEKTIATYSVYSIETAMEMAKAISEFAHSDYGIGITGKLKRSDRYNVVGHDDFVYFVIYDTKNDYYYKSSFAVTKEERSQNKNMVIEKILDQLDQILS